MRRHALLLSFFPLAATAQEATLPEMVVEARRLDEARSRISPTLGAAVSTLDRKAIESLPLGADAPLNGLLLQFPGVVQDSFGEIHVRGEHRNLQYRINGVTIPEGIQGFGAFLDARAVSRLDLLTGALPAQFGYRTGAVVDVTLRSGAADPGGWVGVTAGSFGTVQPSAGWAGVVAGWDVFATGTYRQSTLGIESPTARQPPANGFTEQGRGLFNVSRIIAPETRLSVIGGASASRFGIPANPGQPAEFGTGDSALLRARQWERNQFGIAALQGTRGAFDWQVAGFGRNSTTHYLPDANEIAFNGIATDYRRRSAAFGMQADGAYRLHERHTLRFGVMSMGERTLAANASTVLDEAGDPLLLGSRRARTTWLHGAWLQDEWRVSDRLTVNAGLRADYADQAVQAAQLSPRLNAVWRATDATTLSLGYARYFTPPAQELIQPGLFAGTSGAAPGSEGQSPRPERSHTVSAGVSHRWDERLTLGADAWFKDARDMLDLGQFGRAIVYTPFNYRQGRTYGATATAQWRSGPLEINGSVTLSRATGRDIRSSQFAFDAEELDYIRGKWVRTDHDQLITATAGAVWRAWEGGRVSATAYFGNGLRRGFANSEKGDPYATVNLGVAHRFTTLGGEWEARLDVLNIADARVQLRDGSGIGVGAPQFLARRAAYAGLTRFF